MTTDYDFITVGGGIAGASLAKAMAERGFRVLVVEREKQFKDRVRGEWLAPWGVAETKGARRLPGTSRRRRPRPNGGGTSGWGQPPSAPATSRRLLRNGCLQ